VPITLLHFQEFKELHGEPIAINGRYLFADGALSDGSYQHSEPPFDPEQLAVMQHSYFKTKLDATLVRYRGTYQYILDQNKYFDMGAGPAPPEQAAKDLEQMLGQVQELQAKVQELEQLLPATKLRQQTVAIQDNRRRARESQQTISLKNFPAL
jgi:outer membrane murein-binding lipoprotein Lpp